MNSKRTFVLSALASLLFVVLGPLAYAGGPDRELPEWAFAQRAEVAHLPPVQASLASTTPNQAAESVGIKRVLRPAASPQVAFQSEAIRAAVMQPVSEEAARVVVDMDHGFVYVRRGETQTKLPIEVRSPGAGAQAIAEVAQAGTRDPWLVPYSVVVDGDNVGLRMKDGLSPIDSSVLLPELRQQTLRLREEASVVAAR
jgi:hypothetical protein